MKAHPAVAAAVLLAAGLAPEAGAETVWKLAFNQDYDHPEMIALQNFSDKLKEATKGEYVIDIYPNELLGSQKETIEMVQSGSIEFAIVGGPLLANWSSDLALLNLPYIFKDYKHLKRVVKDKSVVGDIFKSLENRGITVVCANYAGTRNVYTSEKEIRTPADLKGLRIRVMESDAMVKMIEHMGGIGVPLPQGEVYTAIQNGALDGAENSEVTYYNLRQHEVAPIYNTTGHLMVPDYVITNSGFYEQMPKQVKKFFEENLDSLVDEEFELYQNDIAASMEKAVAAGARVVEADQDAFKKAVEPLIRENLRTPRAQSVYEQIQKLRDVKDEKGKKSLLSFF